MLERDLAKTLAQRFDKVTKILSSPEDLNSVQSIIFLKKVSYGHFLLFLSKFWAFVN